MQFDSLVFLLFFIVVFALYQVRVRWAFKKHLLLVASYVFYAFWNPWFLPLLIVSSSFDWWAALRMHRARGVVRARWLTLIVSVNIGVLIYFKYAFFMAETGATFLSFWGINWSVPEFSIILPLGISFYTFHSLSYCIDIFKRRFTPTTSYCDYLLYVAFFPQLVAGPIVRWTYMREQIEVPRVTTWNGVALGVAMMIFGLFEKIVLADAVFAPVANAVFAQSQPGTHEVWLGVIAFSGQIFCDFAGYSTCALGAAMALGFNLPINFRNPYSSLGFSDFWRRWHISLSSWLRDYLYIPLGGGHGSKLLIYRNLMITMVVGGVWHGAGWTFIIWGALHGSYLVAERVVRHYLVLPARLVVLLRPLIFSLTLWGVMLGWVWFRAVDVAQGWYFTKQMVRPALGGYELSGLQIQCLVVFLLMLVVQFAFRNQTLMDVFERLPAPLVALFLGFAAVAIMLSPGQGSAFIYFQF